MKVPILLAGLLPTNRLKMNSFICIFQLFSNTYTNIYFVEYASLATPESISYRNVKSYRNSHQKVFFIFNLTQALKKRKRKKKQLKIFKKYFVHSSYSVFY